MVSLIQLFVFVLVVRSTGAPAEHVRHFGHTRQFFHQQLLCEYSSRRGSSWVRRWRGRGVAGQRKTRRSWFSAATRRFWLVMFGRGSRTKYFQYHLHADPVGCFCSACVSVSSIPCVWVTSPFSPRESKNHCQLWSCQQLARSVRSPPYDSRTLSRHQLPGLPLSNSHLCFQSEEGIKDRDDPWMRVTL